jgi:hypothetical protein
MHQIGFSAVSLFFHMPDPAEDAFSLFLPEGVLTWFDVVSSMKTGETLQIVFEEKNSPPISEETRGRHIESKGFKDITVDDFPVRGRKTTLTFRRRVWKVEGQEKLLKRDIQLVWEGTQLEKEFALFLKD